MAIAIVLTGVAAMAEAAVGPDGAAFEPPPAGVGWDYQIGGSVEYLPTPGAVSRDNADQPWRGSTTSAT